MKAEETLLRNRVRLKLGLCLLGSLLGLSAGSAHAASFQSGNVVVYRVGTGSAALGSNTGTAVFLDEYTPSGTLVQSIAMPTTASGSNKRLVASGTATSEGLLTRSTDGRFIVLTGYDAALGTTPLTSTTGATVNRVVGRVGASGEVDTSTALSDFASGNNPRSAASTDGTNIWVGGGAGGVRYTTFGSTTSTQLSTTLTNIRQTRVFDGQLYITTNSGTTVRLGTVGTGLPTTSGQTISNLPGFPVTGSPYGFFFADLDAGVAGADTVYVADDTPGTIQKYSFVNGNWTASGTISATGVRGLTGKVTGSSVELFVTSGTSLSTLTDTSGYNQTISGTVSSIATAGANTAFRGVALAPAGAANQAPVLDDANFTFRENVSISDAQLSGSDADGDTLAYSTTDTLPAGVTLNNDGSFSGTPTARTTSAGVDVTVTVSDGKGGSDTATINIKVQEALSLVVTQTSDTSDAFDGATSLREAIALANSNSDSSDITFNIGGEPGVKVISVLSQLEITTPTNIRGNTQPGFIAGGAPLIQLNGSGAGAGVHGLLLNASNCRLQALEITGFSGDGVRVASGTGNNLRHLGIHGNGGLGIDLGGDGVTANDADNSDADSGVNNLQNFPSLSAGASSGSQITAQGTLRGTPNAQISLGFYASDAADGSGQGEGQNYIGAYAGQMDSSGVWNFVVTLSGDFRGKVLTSTATAADGSTSEFSQGVTIQDVSADDTAPVVSITDPADKASVSSLSSISGTATDDMGVTSVRLSLHRYSDGSYWNGSSWVAAVTMLTASYDSGTGQWSYNGGPGSLDAGRYQISVFGYDAASNAGKDEHQVSAGTLDTTPPTVSIITPDGTGPVSSLQNIVGSAQDDSGNLRRVLVRINRREDNMWWNGSTWQSSKALLVASYDSATEEWSYNSGPAAPEAGEYNLFAYAYDGANNMAWTVRGVVVGATGTGATSQAGSKPVEVSSASASAGASSVTLNFNRYVNRESALAAERYSVIVNGAPVPVQGVEVAGARVTLLLPQGSVQVDDDAQVSWRLPEGSGNIQVTAK